jgi:dihydroorotase
MTYDLILRGGRVIDPSQRLDALTDVAFSAGNVARVGPKLEAGPGTEVRDVAGSIVTPGLIDLHTHVYWGGTSLSVRPEPVARRSGATTLVDAGSAGPGNFHGFRAHIIERTPVRILPYLNISFAGIFAFSESVMVGECADVRLLDARECLRVAEAHRDLVVGIKVRVGRNTSEANGAFPLELAVEVAEELDLPVMAHIDFPPPRRRDMLERLRPGDVLTHCYRPFPNAPVRRGELRP